MRIQQIYNQSNISGYKKNQQSKNDVTFGYLFEMTPNASNDIKQIIGEYFKRYDPSEQTEIAKTIKDKFGEFSAEFTEGLKEKFKSYNHHFGKSVKTIEDAYPDIESGKLLINSIKLRFEQSRIPYKEPQCLNDLCVDFGITTPEGKDISLSKKIFRTERNYVAIENENILDKYLKETLEKDKEQVNKSHIMSIFSDYGAKGLFNNTFSEKYLFATCNDASQRHYERVKNLPVEGLDSFNFNSK